MQTTSATSDLQQRLAGYPLLDAMLNRRSRRFAKGATLNGGPLAYTSASGPEPLTIEEQAALVFAAGGVTGNALAELPYDTGDRPEAGSGNIMTHFVGRTIGSPDAGHNVALIVMDDSGTWLIRRPQDYPRSDVPGLVRDARDGKLVELFEKSRIRLSDRRTEIPREIPFTPAFNKWSANIPGSTYFLPVNEFTGQAIGILLTAFSDEFGYFVVDETANFQPAGLGSFARSKGGHLNDDLAAGRALTIGLLESTLIYSLAALEQGLMIQNLALMTQALGIGGFPHFASHPYAWFQALGFRMEQPPFARTAGAGRLLTALMNVLKKNIPVPTPVGLEREGEPLLKPFSPPYYPSMEAAVLAFVDYKYGQGSGTMRDGREVTAWRDGAKVQAGIPAYSDRAIAATIAYCDYVHRRFGRFPSGSGPFRTVVAYQAHHLDEPFYDMFYGDGALSPAQREHPAAH